MKIRKVLDKKMKERYRKSKENDKRKARRNKSVEATRLNGRIEYWKRRQKTMAESRFNEFLEERVFVRPKEILPTFTLA